jgi:hypothetical protein
VCFMAINEFLPPEYDDPELHLPRDLDSFYGIILNLMLGIGIAVTLIGLIYSGIHFVTSKGDPKATDKAKSALTYSVIGIFLVIGAFSIKILLLKIIGVEDPALMNAVPGL